MGSQKKKLINGISNIMNANRYAKGVASVCLDILELTIFSKYNKKRN